MVMMVMMVMVMILKQVWRNRWLSSPLDHYVGFRAWLYHAGCIHFTAIFKLITQCHAHTQLLINQPSAISIFLFLSPSIIHIILILINQRLSARLAMVTGKHLAELCYENLHPVNFPFRLVFDFQLLKTYP